MDLADQISKSQSHAVQEELAEIQPPVSTIRADSVVPLEVNAASPASLAGATLIVQPASVSLTAAGLGSHVVQPEVVADSEAPV